MSDMTKQLRALRTVTKTKRLKDGSTLFDLFSEDGKICHED